MFDGIRAVIEKMNRSRRGTITMQSVIISAVAILLIGILYPIGMAAIETYTPGNATAAIVWPLVEVFAVLGVAIAFIRSAVD